MQTNQKIFNFLCIYRNSRPEVFLREVALKICSKFTGEYPCRSEISIKLLCKFIKIVLRHGSSSVSLLHIFRIPFPKNTSRRLFLQLEAAVFYKKTQVFLQKSCFEIFWEILKKANVLESLVNKIRNLQPPTLLR